MKPPNKIDTSSRANTYFQGDVMQNLMCVVLGCTEWRCIVPGTFTCSTIDRHIGMHARTRFWSQFYDLIYWR